jgi:hypothetical protein
MVHANGDASNMRDLFSKMKREELGRRQQNVSY